MAKYLYVSLYADNFTCNWISYTCDKIEIFDPKEISTNCLPGSTDPLRYARNRQTTPYNMTSKYSPFFMFSDVSINNTIKVVLKCVNGYKFNSGILYGTRNNLGTSSTFSITNSSYMGGNPIQKGYVSFNANYTELSIELDYNTLQNPNGTLCKDYDTTNNYGTAFILYNITFDTVPIIPQYTISYNLTNCVSDYNQTSVDEGTQVTMTITPNLGYVLPNAPTYTTGGVTTQFDKIDNSTYTATFTVMNDVTINSSGIAGYEISQTLTNCTSNYNNWYIQDGVTYTIVLTANEGYYFPANSCEYIDSWGVTTQMIISQDGKTASCTFTGESIYQYSGQRITGDAVSIPSEKFGFIGIYKPTNSELLQLALQRFVTEQGETVDLTQYILTLRKYYYDMPIDGSESVYYGTYNTNIMCNFVKGEIIDIDCGEITVNELYHNSLDYENTTATIYLPFIGNTPIDTKRIMGKTLSLKYKLNPVNGDCVALLYDDIGEIYLASGNLSFQIPIKEYNTSVYVNEYVENPLYMAKQTPYIELITDEIYNENPRHGYDNNMWVLISTCNGYVMFSDIELHPINKINKDEYDEIISLLQNGIIV